MRLGVAEVVRLGAEVVVVRLGAAELVRLGALVLVLVVVRVGTFVRDDVTVFVVDPLSERVVVVVVVLPVVDIRVETVVPGVLFVVVALVVREGVVVVVDVREGVVVVVVVREGAVVVVVAAEVGFRLDSAFLLTVAVVAVRLADVVGLAVVVAALVGFSRA